LLTQNFGGMEMSEKETYEISPIGKITRNENEVFLEINESIRPALKQLNHFSHVIILWWADQHDNEDSRNKLQTKTPYAEDVLTGVFACRSEYRPNPIALITCKILDVNEETGIVKIGNIDAFAGTTILDLKGYFPVCDRVKNATIPEWLSFWPEWMPDGGLGLEYKES
jgi:tRNA (adenine37-N6)-methyltransferase